MRKKVEDDELGVQKGDGVPLPFYMSSCPPQDMVRTRYFATLNGLLQYASFAVCVQMVS